MPLLATLGAALVGYAAPAAVALARTADRATYGSAPLPFLVVAVAGLTAFAAGGVALGGRVRWPLLPIAATVAAYFSIAYLSSTNSMDMLSPFDERGVTVALFPGMLVAQTVLWFAAVAAACWFYVCRIRAGTAAAAVAAVAAAVPLLGAPPYPYDEDPSASITTCRASAESQVCLSQVHDYLRPQITAYVD